MTWGEYVLMKSYQLTILKMFYVVPKSNMTLNEPEMDYEFSNLACKFNFFFFS